MQKSFSERQAKARTETRSTISGSTAFLIRENLTIDEVVERIAGEDPDRNPPKIRTPEDLRGEMQTR
ncbi:MAG: hypothetical protein II008_06910 [Oscillospiraceae bacterium]|nr:hypothetical protein [Oscillospiraceae bacterium]